MNKKLTLYLLIGSLAFMAVACATVPITGRKQLDFIPSETMLSMSFQQYSRFMEKNQESTDPQKVAMVQRVGRNIQQAVEQYMADNDMAYRLEDYAWEFTLVENDKINAWALPGGKVVVYTGILPVAQDENGLAVIIGHEVAHAIAQHGNERMSQALLTELGGLALNYALQEKPDKTRQVWGAAFGLGAQFGVLMPFSRLHEKEADHLGLIFMAMAGYDPRGAVDFWQRMAEQKDGGIPAFLSTHPSDEARIENIRALIPEVMKYYNNQ
jgi:predicted Zn-dependent protease